MYLNTVGNSHLLSRPGSQSSTRHGSRHASLQANPSHNTTSTRHASLQLTPRLTSMTPPESPRYTPRQGLATAAGQGPPSQLFMGGAGGGGILRGTSSRFPQDTLNTNNNPSNNHTPQVSHLPRQISHTLLHSTLLNT